MLVQDNAEAALADAEQAVLMNPEWPKGHYRLATALEKLERIPQVHVAACALETTLGGSSHSQVQSCPVHLTHSTCLTGETQLRSSARVRLTLDLHLAHRSEVLYE